MFKIAVIEAATGVRIARSRSWNGAREG